MKVLHYFLIVVLLFSCKNDKKKGIPIVDDHDTMTFKYAKGFQITEYANYKLLEIKSPWPKASTTFRYALVDRKKSASLTLDRDAYDAIILTPIERIVVTSTTHIPALELLNVEATLVGFPGTEYISSERTRERIDNGTIRELGKNEGINTEVLLEVQPEVVVGFGVDGVNKTFETVEKSGIPVIYNGDWVEASPLAKAEWLKFFGALFQKEKQADSAFNTIESNYLKAVAKASMVATQPTILSGAMHKDVWYMPNGTSPEAQFLKDANVDYLWSDTSGKGSLALSFEAVFEKAQHAQIWLSPSYYGSYKALKEASDHYTRFDAFQNRAIYTFANTAGATGGVLYYELGTARPDLVLKDIIKVCHPELLPDYTPYFFKPLK